MSLNLSSYEHLFTKRWYVQSFNGVPLYLNHGGVSAVDLTPRAVGVGYSAILGFFSSDLCEMYYPWESLEEIYAFIIEQYRKDAHFLDRLIKQSFSEVAISERVIERIKKLDLSQLTDHQLLLLLRELNDAYPWSVATSHIIEGYSLCSDTFIKTRLLETLTRMGEEKNFAKYLTILTSPSESSLVFEEECALRALAERINQKISSFATMESTLILEQLEHHTELLALLKEHQERYIWISASYAGAPSPSLLFFIHRMKALFYSPLSASPIPQLEKKELLARLHLDSELLMHLHLTERITSWQDVRKVGMLRCVVFIERLVLEVSRRYALPKELLCYLLPHEFTEEFLSTCTSAQLTHRRQNCAIIYQPSECALFDGSDALLLRRKFEQQSAPSSVMEVTGLCACIGRAIGKVRICKTLDDIFAFPSGYVLVTGMTRPEFVPAMKKAIAIVTDEGGLTSHAAIVSRELGVPCVIGTKMATKVFANDDLVEVAAQHGRVKKVR